MTTNQHQNILLAGASGVLGRHIARALTDAGHKVTGLGRGEGNGVRADLMDRDALLRAVDGEHFDTVVHAATALRKPPVRHRDMYATDALRTEGTAHLIEAARATGARRFVTESMVFGYGYGDFGDQPITEDDEFGPRGTDPELERHLAGMRVKEQLTFGAPGLEGVALRFGLFYGPGGTDALLPLLRKRQLPAPADHGRALPWVELTDAARAVAAAVEHGRAGQAYNISGPHPDGLPCPSAVRGRGVRAAEADVRAPVADQADGVRAHDVLVEHAGVGAEGRAGTGLDARVPLRPCGPGRAAGRDDPVITGRAGTPGPCASARIRGSR
ncbi:MULTISPECIES: NAD(P)-dependent oxidoreductase [Streptomyces]|uniref:NAD-dependent epimerase/dehydratase n=1 Tax=Streptomyces sviceus (strain ATCC 29083 / DSM 924 / JCM 4929 / NBRC 13980 / NCIMB 11184 / NRRL 5439 / UC 5370) TaxID=463191 RepID=B5I9A7_STRX2|nr:MULTISPECIES: NAD(P)-dependent oxidoreductase [Streptomyces]EDY61662.2 NAD-dependent epimerase/dehydratase [Streptomyces sviceus ATCC 29083]